MNTQEEKQEEKKEMKLEEILEITGKILCISGLRVGGSKEATGIGETDNPVIRHPITNIPYLPGSSVKGKLRSILEWRYSPDTQGDGKPCRCGDCFICKLFGRGTVKKDEKNQPTRLIFRDGTVSQTIPQFLQNLAEIRKMEVYDRDALEKSLPGSLVETKKEVACNRKQGIAQEGSLRELERLPAGTVLDFSFNMRIFSEDKEKKRISIYFEKLAEAFEQLEKDALGGCGSRGYGKVEVYHDSGKKMSDYLREEAKKCQS